VAKDWSNPRLLWVGVDWDRKGGELLLRAFRAAAIPGATLDLVGRHPNVDTPGVVGHGVIREPERLAAMFERATLFVLPSRFDASPIVLLEAAAAGTPLIASATGGTPEHVGDAGLTVSPGNLGGLVQAMRHAASPEAAARFRDAALAQARVRTWDSAAARMIESFELNGGPPAR
jgi:glycosyltransferase involved in cell wall biosynthesis